MKKYLSLFFAVFSFGTFAASVTDLQKFDTVTAMSAYVPTGTNSVIALGKTAPNDGGGGMYFYSIGSVVATNATTVFAAPYGAATGRWIAINTVNGLYGSIIATGSTASISAPDRFGQVVNVKDFGALGDGTTDDKAAIQLALNRANTLGGATVWFPPGVYRNSNTLKVYSNTKIVGSGRGATIIRSAAGAYAGTAFNGVSWYADFGLIGITNSSVESLSIDHLSLSNQANGIMIGMDGAGTMSSNCVVRDVQIDGYKTHQYLIWNYKSDSTKIMNCFLDGHVNSLSLTNEQEGIETYGGKDVLIQGNTLVNIGADAINDISDTTNVSARANHRILDNHIANSRVGLSAAVVNSADMGMTNVIFQGNTVRGATVRGAQLLDAGGSGIYGVDFSHNLFDSCVEGITLYGTVGSTNMSGVSVAFNTIRNTTGANGAVYLQNWYSADIVGNKIDLSASYGIFNTVSGPVSIRNNVINGLQRNGITVDTVTNVIIKANIITSNNIENVTAVLKPAIYATAVNYGVINDNVVVKQANENYAGLVNSGNNVEMRNNSVGYATTVAPIWNNLATSPNSGAPKYSNLAGFSQLWADAANVLWDQYGGTSGSTVPQEFRVARYYDGTDGEYITERWNSTIAEIGTDKVGAGTQRSLRFTAGSNMYMTFSGSDKIVWTATQMQFNSGNTFDFGAKSGASNPRAFYATGALDGNTLYITNTVGIAQTITTPGTTGNQTINKSSGRVNIAAGGTTVTVSDTFVTASSTVLCVVATNDTTATIKNVVPTAGGFTVTITAAATAETAISFLVVN